MKKRILLFPLILMNTIGLVYAMEGEPKKELSVYEQALELSILTTVQKAVYNNELNLLLQLPPESLIHILIQYLQKRFDEELVASLKSAWPIVQTLSSTCKLFNACCKQVEVTKLLSQVLSGKEKINLLYAPANKPIREKRKIGTHAAYMMIEALKRAGVDLDQWDAQNTALMLEASFGKPEMVQALIQSGADINAQDCFGCTALMKAVLSFRIDMVRILLDAGADKFKINQRSLNVVQLCQAYLAACHNIKNEEDCQKLKAILEFIKTYEQPQQLLMPSEEPTNNNMEE